METCHAYNDESFFPFFLWKVLFGHDFQNKSCQIKLHMLPLWAECVCFELYSYRLAHLWVKLLKKRKHTLGNVICSTWQGWFSLYHLYHRPLLTIWVFAWVRLNSWEWWPQRCVCSGFGGCWNICWECVFFFFKYNNNEPVCFIVPASLWLHDCLEF